MLLKKTCNLTSHNCACLQLPQHSWMRSDKNIDKNTDFCSTAAPEYVHENAQQQHDSQRRNYRKSEQESGSRPFGLLGWNPWGSVGCGPAAVVCRPLRKTRGLQSARCVLRTERKEWGEDHQTGSSIGRGQTQRFTSTGRPRQNCFQMLRRVSLTSVLAVRQDIFGHLVAAAHVVLVRFGHSQLADWHQRSAVVVEQKLF